MKREVRLLFSHAIDSLLLAIEHFNRPWDRGRAETVLMLLDHSFEMLLKSIILHRGGRIREKGATQTFGFDHCIRKCLSDAQVKCLTEPQASTLRTINALRDGACHYIINISEQMFYLYIQAGVTTFADILREVFQKGLGDFLPGRVLPISTEPPSDLIVAMDKEFHQIQELLAIGVRRGAEARARLRAIAIVENAVSGRDGQPGEGHIRRLMAGIRAGTDWNTMFPGIASLRIDSEGTGMTFSIRFSKTAGLPVRPVREGEEPGAVVAEKRVSELGYYNLGLRGLARHIGIGENMLGAVIKHLHLQEDLEYFKIIQIGKSCHKLYSQKALRRLQEEIPRLDISAVWQQWRPRRSHFK